MLIVHNATITVPTVRQFAPGVSLFALPFGSHWNHYTIIVQRNNY